jgi:hypothetical protein
VFTELSKLSVEVLLVAIEGGDKPAYTKVVRIDSDEDIT